MFTDWSALASIRPSSAEKQCGVGREPETNFLWLKTLSPIGDFEVEDVMGKVFIDYQVWYPRCRSGLGVRRIVRSHELLCRPRHIFRSSIRIRDAFEMCSLVGFKLPRRVQRLRCRLSLLVGCMEYGISHRNFMPLLYTSFHKKETWESSNT